MVTALHLGNFDTAAVITAYSASQRQFDVAFEAAVNSFSEGGCNYDSFLARKNLQIIFKNKNGSVDIHRAVLRSV